MSYKLSEIKIWLKTSFYYAAWASITVFVFYAIAAKVFNAYLIYPWLDIPTHFCEGMAMTYFFTAVIWEFLEFLLYCNRRPEAPSAK